MIALWKAETPAPPSSSCTPITESVGKTLGNIDCGSGRASHLQNEGRSILASERQKVNIHMPKRQNKQFLLSL